MIDVVPDIIATCVLAGLPVVVTVPPPPAHDDPVLVSAPLTCSMQVVPDNPERVMPDDTSPALNVLTAVKMLGAPTLAVVWMTWAGDRMAPIVRASTDRKTGSVFMNPSGSTGYAASPDITARSRPPLGVYSALPDLYVKMLIIGSGSLQEAVEVFPAKYGHDLGQYLILLVCREVV